MGGVLDRIEAYDMKVLPLEKWERWRATVSGHEVRISSDKGSMVGDAYYDNTTGNMVVTIRPYMGMSLIPVLMIGSAMVKPDFIELTEEQVVHASYMSFPAMDKRNSPLCWWKAQSDLTGLPLELVVYEG